MAFLIFILGIVNLSFLDVIYLPVFDPLPWIAGSLLLIFGLILYAFAFPEKYFEKTFDIVGASHQIWHVLVLITSYLITKESFIVYNNRLLSECPS